MSANGRPPCVDTRWLTRLSEEIIDPTLPIIDAHHHLWEVTGYRYLLDDLLADLESGHNVEATVFVQCGYEYHGGTATPPAASMRLSSVLPTCAWAEMSMRCSKSTSPPPVAAFAEFG